MIVILATVMRRIFKYGNLSLIDANGQRYQICSFKGPKVVLRLTSPRVARRLISTSSMAWCEAYMDGDLVFEEGGLGGFLEAWGRSENYLDQSWFGRLVNRVYSVTGFFSHYNPVKRSRHNVAHHYDLSAKLYDYFLDSDRQYSCAYFPTGNEDLETAQLLKKRHIASKLYLKPGMTILDIGCGWGGLAIYLAQSFDCRVIGVTLSEEQFKLATRRVARLGLESRVRIELRDYRSLSEPVDRIVSVGMLEHVGQYQYNEYFSQVKKLLKSDGVALIHSIARMEKPRPIGAWIRRYIFPGAYIPSLSQLTRSLEDQNLWLTDVENLRLHYAKTLNLWWQRFTTNRGRVAKLYDERFCRMWEMYLQGCEMTFKDQYLTVFQLQLSRDIDTLPISRDYMYRVEKQLNELDYAPSTPAEAGRRSANQDLLI